MGVTQTPALILKRPFPLSSFLSFILAASTQLEEIRCRASVSKLTLTSVAVARAPAPTLQRLSDLVKTYSALLEPEAETEIQAMPVCVCVRGYIGLL